jgi:hypothetical protein
MKKHTHQPKKNQQVFPLAELSSETFPELSKLSESELDMIVGGLNPQPLPPISEIARQPEFMQY